MDKPNPTLPMQTTSSYIMSKSWADANGAATPASVKNKVENFATNNANGTVFADAILVESHQDVIIDNDGYYMGVSLAEKPSPP